MANLFEINAQLTDLIDPETGEIADVEQFEKLNLDLDTKVKNIALWIVNLNADVAALDEQEKKFKERKAAAKRKAESLKEYLDHFLAGEKRAFPEVTISYRKSEQIAIADGTVLSERFLRYKDPEVDKTALKAALKQGEVIEGVTLESKSNIQVK